MSSDDDRPPPPTIEPPHPMDVRAKAPERPAPPDLAAPNIFTGRRGAPKLHSEAEQRKITRRRLVRLGMGGAVLLGLGGTFAYQTNGYDLPASTAARLLSLTPKEFLIVSALASRILRRDQDDLPLPEEVEAAFAIDVLVARLDGENRRDLLRLLHALEHVLPWGAGVPSRFTRASAEQQDAVLTAMSEHSVGLLRGAFEALKSLCVMAYFSHPLSWGAIGYDGPLVARPAEGWVAAARLSRGGSP